MQIKFYTSFRKRENSTKRPDDTVNTPVVLNGHLKEPTDVLNPAISFQTIADQVTPTVYIYAHIPIFGKYYFVSKWAFEDGLWTVYLTEDVLATYKVNIGNTSAYIERASAMANGSDGYYDPRIIDLQYPAKASYDYQSVRLAPPWTGFDVDDGTYILGVINGMTGGSTGGAVRYFAMTSAQMADMCHYLLSDQFFTAIGFSPTMTVNQQISHDVAKTLLNPFQYIVSCMWFPADVETICGSIPQLSNINVGSWTTTIGQGYILDDQTGYWERFTFTLPQHPQASTRGYYLNYSPYSEFTMYIPPYGSFPLDPTFIDNLSTRSITCKSNVDIITGKATMEIYNTPLTPSSQMLTHHVVSTQIGVPIQLAQVTSDYMKTATTLLQAGAGIAGVGAQAFAGNVAGAVSSGSMALSSIGNAIQSAMPMAITQGANGSFLGLTNLMGPYAYVTCKFTWIVDEDLPELGRPLCQVRDISTFTGFIKCGEVTIDYPAYDTEKEKIHNYLLSGFFWE